MPNCFALDHADGTAARFADLDDQMRVEFEAHGLKPRAWYVSSATLR